MGNGTTNASAVRTTMQKTIIVTLIAGGARTAFADEVAHQEMIEGKATVVRQLLNDMFAGMQKTAFNLAKRAKTHLAWA